MNRRQSGSKGRARAVGAVAGVALIAGALAVAGPSAYGSGATNRLCAEGVCTTTALTSSVNPVVVGQPVTYTAEVKPPLRGSGQPTGTVSFTDGGVTIAGCSARPLESTGFATCTETPASAGQHAIAATYSGDKTFKTSSGTLPTETAIAAGPTAIVTSPANGQTYVYDEVVTTSFRCVDGAGGPGIASCVDGDGRPAPSGTLDTSSVGYHSYSVTALSSDGQRSVSTIDYRVIPPSNRFKVSRLSSRHGVVSFNITVPGAGQIDVFESAWDKNKAVASSVVLQPAPHRFVFARRHLIAKRAGTGRISVTPNKMGERLLKKYHLVRIRLFVTYQPNGGSPSTVWDIGYRLRKYLRHAAARCSDC
jgi:hypothetical protein